MYKSKYSISEAMEESISTQTKMTSTKLKLSDLNPHLMCVLCGGYYIDATTIVECLHSFCRSCIVKHLESSKYCPICEVQVHKTKPLVNIRPDKTLQDIVYKLVPGLFASEMRNRRKFYKERPHYIKPSDSESVGEVSGERKMYVNDENITFSLVYHLGPVSINLEDCYKEISPPLQNVRRYFKCPTAVTIHHLKKLLKAKYELSDNNYKMEVYLKNQPLNEDLTLLDISYIYLWKSKVNLDLTYKIFENVVKRRKIEEKSNEGELKETGNDLVVSDLQPMTSEGEKSDVKVEVNGKDDVKEEESTAPAPVVNVLTSTDGISATAKKPDFSENIKAKEKTEKTEDGLVRENGVSGSESKEVQLQISESGVMSVSQVEDSQVVKTMEDALPKMANNHIITGIGVNKGVKGNGEMPKPEQVNPMAEEQRRKQATKPAKPYKTIRCSPKTWHPVIPKEKLRPTLMKTSDEPKKPLKFFKMRNMPRFLGNPSSGVKPMFAEPPENNVVGKKKFQDGKSDSTKNKILKIDPKTLRPIEKEEMKVTQTPNIPNLLTNPFIPNNNHFLFSDLHLLPPNSGSFFNSKTDSKSDKGIAGAFKNAVPNGSYPPICFPSPEHTAGFYPFSNLTKPPNFPFPITDKMDPLLRASRLSPFGNLTEFNMAGFHASLPPSISRLLNPHHHFRKITQTLDKKNNEESTKDSTKNCDGSIKVSNAIDECETKERKENQKIDMPSTKAESDKNQRENNKECNKADEVSGGEGGDGGSSSGGSGGGSGGDGGYGSGGNGHTTPSSSDTAVSTPTVPEKKKEEKSEIRVETSEESASKDDVECKGVANCKNSEVIDKVKDIER